MAILGRLLVLGFAYLAGCGAASIVLLLATLGAGGLAGFPPAALLVVAGTAMIAAIALLPSLVVVVLAEAFALRSIVLYGAAGGILALALGCGIDFAGYPGGPGDAFDRPRQLLAGSGIAGGLVYWAFAGRKAGSWKA